MPLDAICLQAVINEIKPQLVGSRIEKIQQPSRDQVIFLLRGNHRLLLSCNPSQPRFHITEDLRDNPSQPPMFCMLLRKYLSGGIITSVEQTPMERVVTLQIEARNELGECGKYALIFEGLGRHSNLILCSEDGRIIDCVRRVDWEMSPQRQVLPGLFYRLPTAVKKQNPLTIKEEEFCALLPREKIPLDRWILDTFTAISPLVAREIVFQGTGCTDGTDREKLWPAFARWQNTVSQGAFAPVMLRCDERMVDFTYFPVSQYGLHSENISFSNFGSMLDTFYRQREQAERVKQKGQDLLKTVQSTLSRLKRKILLQEKELETTAQRDTWRLYGELITANLYQLKRGAGSIKLPNYYEENCPEVEIPLDNRLSPQENAARYFKQYNKAKTAERVLTEQIQKGREELRYLESVWQELQQCEGEQDFNDVRAELSAGGYLRRGGGKKQAGFQRPTKPREFHSTTGFQILVGRNNMQNDKLTGKTAQKWDLWFHTRHIHGSHVILCTRGEKPDAQSIREAACLAAYYSQGRGGKKIAVDYTMVKFVKKPAGCHPGMVVYDHQQTVYADPEEELIEKLKK